MWLVFVIEGAFFLNLGVFGIYPRTMFGLIGIVTAPVLHGDLLHLVSNTIPLMFLGVVLFFYYNKIATAVFLRCYFVTNILVWIFARPSLHIGASGLVYGLASFLIFYGFFKRDLRSLIISVIVTMLYGGIFYGVLPSNPMVSWESHLFGAAVGLWTAVSLRKKKA
ncbi:rhomboid family intramembrane serine protease [Fulvivirga sp. RKSG066]|nr:rhomboid family intramembrane serine protease [Fulvivirga aurantia]